MDIQQSQDYNVDNRYHGVHAAVDNEAGQKFLAAYTKKKKAASRSTLTAERQEDNRFIVSGPGDTLYSFKNAYGAPRAPQQRRVERTVQ